jgi:hypothetical protein
MCVEIELVGGPADGRRLPLCGDPMNPQPTIDVAELLPMAPLTDPAQPPGPAPVFQRVRYARDPEPTRAATGPMWLYRRQAPAGPPAATGG